MVEKLYTAQETAEILRKDIGTIYNMLSRRELTHIKGRPVLIPESSIQEFIQRRLVAAKDDSCLKI